MVEQAQPTVRGLLRRAGQTEVLTGDLNALLATWRSGGCLWLDVTAPDAQLVAALQEPFDVDAIDLAKALDREHRAHVVEHDASFFLEIPVPMGLPGVLHRQYTGREWRNALARELDIYCGQNFLLTLHGVALPALDAVFQRHSHTPVDPDVSWPDLPLYSLCEEALRAFNPFLDLLEEEHDRLERRIFSAQDRRTMPEIFAVKRHLLGMRRVIGPLRDAMGSLARRDFPYLGADSRLLFADLYDRSLRLLELEESLRDMLSGLVDATLSVQSNRMNEVMKGLTIIATIMMPLTVITGFFGMNFQSMPFEDSPAGFWGTVAFMTAVTVGLFAYMRARRWW